MALVFDGDFQVFKVAGMGPYDNNGYVLGDPKTREAYVVDAPAEIERLLDEARDWNVRAVLITHTHPDHVAGYADLKRLTGLPVAVHPADEPRLPGKPDLLLNHNDDLPLGGIRVRVLHTPGHTPGGVCLHVGGVLVSGDTLFPGGPGRTSSPDTFKQVVGSIAVRLLTLADGTAVLPGHGADTTIARSKEEYAAFAARPHPDDLHGHVNWLTS